LSKGVTLLYIRLGLGIMMLFCAIEVFRAARTLANRELIMISRRIGATILFFGLLRIAGGFADDYLRFEFAYLTTLSVYLFWLVVYFFFWKQRRVLQSDEVGADGRTRISQNVDNIAAEMRRFNRKLDKVLQQ
jgi:hypothetical protein